MSINEPEKKFDYLMIGDIEVQCHPRLTGVIMETKDADSFIKYIKSKRESGEIISPLTIAVSLSRPTRQSLEIEGYYVVADIGTPRQVKLADMTKLAESAAAAIEQIARVLPRNEEIYLVLSCPVAIAFMIGSLLSHSVNFRILHWENEYKVLPKVKRKSFLKKIAKQK